VDIWQPDKVNPPQLAGPPRTPPQLSSPQSSVVTLDMIKLTPEVPLVHVLMTIKGQPLKGLCTLSVTLCIWDAGRQHISRTTSLAQALCSL